MIRKHLEVKTYMFGDIAVTIEIDYEKKLVSLIQWNGEYNSPHRVNAPLTPKEYVFVKRGPEFRNGWLNILEGMKYAIEQAFDELEAYLKAVQKDKEESVEAVLMEASGIVKKKGEIYARKNTKKHIGR